ncbi:MAG: PAS domain S-box protein, partial [Candidatus Thorarchaeota archaeon]
MDVENERIFWSDELYSIFGIDKDAGELSFERFLELIHPEDRETIKGQYERGESFRSDYRIAMEDGSVKHIHEEVFIEHEESEKIKMLRGTAQDITERKQAEIGLEQSEERYRTIFDNTLVGVIRARFEDGKTLFCNEAAAQIFGYETPDEAIEDFVTAEHFVDPEYRERAQQQVLESDGKLTILVEMTKRNGERFWTRASSTTNVDEGYTDTIFIDVTERVRAEEELRKSEEKYRTIVQSMSDIIFVHDKDNVYTEIYTSDEDYLIGSKDEYIGHHPRTNSPPELVETFEMTAAKVRLTGVPESFDYSMIIKEEEKWFTTTLSLHEDGESIISVAREMTEKKLAELALEISEDRFRKFFDNAPIYFYMVSPEGLILNASKEALKALGYSKDELVGQPVTAIYAPEVLIKMQELFEGWKETGHIKEVETTIITKNGERREVILLVDAQYDSEGEFLNSISIQLDITDRKITEEALRESENRFKAVVESSFNGIFIHIDDKIVEANQSFADMLGSTKDLLIGRNSLDLITEESREIVLNSVQQGEDSSMLLEFLRNDGSIARIETFASPCIYQGKNARIVAVRDITEMEEAKDALEKSEDQMRSLFKGIPVPTYAWQGIGDDLVLVDFNDEAETETLGGIKKLLGQKASVIHKEQPELFETLSRIYKNKIGEEQETSYKFQTVDKESTIQARMAFVPPDLVIVHALDVTRERMAQKALADSEAQKDSILRVVPVGIGIVKDRILTYVSNTLVNMIGYTRDELLGKNSRMLYTNDDEYLRVGKYKYEQIEKYGTGSIDTQFVCKDGSIIDVDLRSTPIDLNNLDKGVTFTALDISTRIRAARAISDNEEKYRLLIDSMGQGIVILQGSPPKVVYANKSIEKLTGYPPEGLIDLGSKEFVDLFHQEKSEQALKTIEGIINGTIKSPLEGVEHKVQHQDGRMVWLLGHPKGIMYDGKPAFRQIFVDVTSRRIAEEELKTSEEMFRDVTSSMQEGILVVDQDRKVKYSNKKYQIMWGISKELMETKDDAKILEFILDQLPDPLDYLEKVGDLINSQNQSFNTILLKDGRIFDRYSFPLISENKVKGRAWIFRDISDEVTVDKKIKKEREALSNFAHRMSHELKNTLAAIGGHASLLEDEHSQ